MHRFISRRLKSACVLVGCWMVVSFLLAPATALAGPPYLTDDPEPTDTSHWEIYNFAQASYVGGTLDAEAGLDLNYGAAKDLQLTAVLPFSFDNAHGISVTSLRMGTGMIELGVKYRFLHQSDGSWIPDASVFPQSVIPTEHGFGYERTNFYLPIWVEKDLGLWSVFGGGGYEVDPGPGARNFWQGGIAANRTMNKRLQLGLEVYGQTTDARVEDGYTAINAAITYKLVEHWSLLASLGPSWIQGGGHGGVFYLSLKADY